jgi:hypothetical protein
VGKFTSADSRKSKAALTLDAQVTLLGRLLVHRDGQLPSPDGGHHLAECIKASHEHLRATALLQVLDGADGHHVVGAEHQPHLGMLLEELCGELVGFVDLPVGRLLGHDADARIGAQAAFGAALALLGIVRCADAFDDDGLVGLAHLVGQELGRKVRALLVVHADERHRLHARSRHGFGVKAIVEIDDVDAGILGDLEHRHQPDRVAGGDDDGPRTGLNRVVDKLDLLFDRRFLCRGLDLKINRGLVLCLARATLHFHEEWVGKRLHDQGDALSIVGRDGGLHGTWLSDHGAHGGARRVAAGGQQRQPQPAPQHPCEVAQQPHWRSWPANPHPPRLPRAGRTGSRLINGAAVLVCKGFHWSVPAMSNDGLFCVRPQTMFESSRNAARSRNPSSTAGQGPIVMLFFQ